MKPIVCSASNCRDRQYAAGFAVDGHPSSRWISEPKQEPQWFALDLGRPVTVKRVDVCWHASGRAAAAAVSVSKNGVDWTRVGRVEGATAANCLDGFQFRERRGVRHVRIDCLKLPHADATFSIVHVLLNGRKIIAAPARGAVEAPRAPFRNRRLSPDRRARDLVKRLTFEELLDLTGGFAGFFISPLPRFGLPAISFADASMGIRLNGGAEIDRTVSFPALVALAATWDSALAAAYARSIGEECRAYGVHTLLGPGVNIYRSAMCGRNFEYLGEDPFLASRMAVAYIRALQATGVMACIKHFACNNSEWMRHEVNTVVDPRAMQEIYLPAFRAAIAEADVKTVMTAYNYWNGAKASENRELIEGVLRRDLKHRHLVMSDWGAVWDGEKALASGQDLVMPENETVRAFAAAHPERRTEVETQLRRMAFSILRTVIAMGYYDGRYASPELFKRFKRHEDVSLETARQAITLLQNRNALLPLKARDAGAILVTGSAAAKTSHSGGGSGFVEGYNHAGYFEALRKIGGRRVILIENPSDEELRAADIVVACPHAPEAEGFDRWFELPEEQEALLRRAAALNPRTVVVLTQGGGVRMTGWADRAGAIVMAYYGGQRAGVALTDVLFGRVNPSGKLPFTIEREFADSPAAASVPEFVLRERDSRLLTEGRETKALLKERGIVFPCDMPYAEGIAVGYRWYESRGIPPLFPFGHGLSYTEFRYSRLEIEVARRGRNPVVSVVFTVRNTGGRAGRETAQVYVGDPEASVARPPKELKGFAKVALRPGDTKRVKIRLERSAFAFWDPTTRGWRIEPGIFDILVGSSSGDIRLTGQCRL